MDDKIVGFVGDDVTLRDVSSALRQSTGNGVPAPTAFSRDEMLCKCLLRRVLRRSTGEFAGVPGRGLAHGSYHVLVCRVVLGLQGRVPWSLGSPSCICIWGPWLL